MTKCVSNSYQSTWGFLYHISFSNIWNLLTLKLANFWHSAISDSVDHHCSSQQVWPQSQHVFKAEILSFILILHKLNRRQFVHTEAFHTMRRALHVLSAVMSLGQCECCKCIAFITKTATGCLSATDCQTKCGYYQTSLWKSLQNQHRQIWQKEQPLVGPLLPSANNCMYYKYFKETRSSIRCCATSCVFSISQPTTICRAV